MEKIRILEVVDNWYPIIDGVVNVVNNYARLLNEYDGVECDVLCPWYPNSNNGSGNYKVIRTISMSGGKYGVRLPLPMIDIKLKKYLKENHYDIVHCHSPVTLSRTVLRYAKKNNIPVVFTVHTRYHEEINRSVKLKFLQKFAMNFLLYSIKRMDYLWAVSDGNRECLKNTYKIDLPCITMRNGTDIGQYDLENATNIANQLRQKYQIAKNEKVLLFVGRLVVVKNISLLIDSLKMLIDKGEEYRLVIVGDGDYKNKLENQVCNLKLTEKVHFAGSINNKEELSAYYLLADLFLFASTFDSCPLVTKEAAALSLPTLLVKDSSSAEEIIDGHNGYVAELDSAKWAEKIEEIFSDTATYNNVKQNCKVELYKSWEQIVDEVLIKYKQIIKQGKQNRLI